MKASIQFSLLIARPVYGMSLLGCTAESSDTKACPAKVEVRQTDGQSIRLVPGKGYPAKLTETDPDMDALTYSWEILEESRDSKVGGDAESRPKSLSGHISLFNRPETTLTVPAKTGAYRLFGYVFDGKGGAAHVNIPFRVESPLQVAAQDKGN